MRLILVVLIEAFFIGTLGCCICFAMGCRESSSTNAKQQILKSENATPILAKSETSKNAMQNPDRPKNELGVMTEKDARKALLRLLEKYPDGFSDIARERVESEAATHLDTNTIKIGLFHCDLLDRTFLYGVKGFSGE